MCTPEQFLQNLHTLASRPLTYKLGHSGKDGSCDCIGLVIGALSLSGVSWPGIHGSNWAARNAVSDLRKISSASDLRPGDLVFKARTPNETAYALPSRYAKDPDPRDYYHVGVVTGISPLTITHMTTPTVKTDTALGRWSHTGTLKYLTQGSAPAEKELIPMKAVVTSPDGNPVKIRTAPDATVPYLVKLSPGTLVTVPEKNDDWCRVEIEGLKGYMMTRFLSFDLPQPEDEVTLTLPRSLADALLQALSRV